MADMKMCFTFIIFYSENVFPPPVWSSLAALKLHEARPHPCCNPVQPKSDSLTLKQKHRPPPCSDTVQKERRKPNAALFTDPRTPLLFTTAPQSHRDLRGFVHTHEKRRFECRLTPLPHKMSQSDLLHSSWAGCENTEVFILLIKRISADCYCAFTPSESCWLWRFIISVRISPLNSLSDWTFHVSDTGDSNTQPCLSLLCQPHESLNELPRWSSHLKVTLTTQITAKQTS